MSHSNAPHARPPFPLQPPLTASDFDPPNLQNFEAQVAGHPSTVFKTRQGKIIVKRALAAEIRFYYTHLSSDQHPESPLQSARDQLHTLTARCHGAVTLSEAENSKANGNSKTAEDAAVVLSLPRLIDLAPPVSGISTDANALVLENILHGFVAPNVLDIKLGTQLWDESSTPEKRERMIIAAQTCTSAEFGARLTGWQTWDDARREPFTVSKQFGKSILTRPQLEMGARIFFCSSRQSTDLAEYNSIIRNGKKNSSEAVAALPSLPGELVHKVVTSGLAPQLAAIFDVVKNLEWRVRGGSVLLVYEGNQAALEQKLRDSPSDTDSFCKARLIDFAHASFVPGQGPDAGYVQGLQTAISLLDHVAAETAPSQTV